MVRCEPKGGVMNPGMKAIGLCLKSKRLASDMTQADMAKRMDVSKNTISNWETGERCLDLQKAWNMADALGLSIDELVGRDLYQKNN